MVVKDRPGCYLAIEGIMGSGKTVQGNRLVELLVKRYGKQKVVDTYEPGGSPIAAVIRQVVQSRSWPEEMQFLCEAYLYAGSRAQTLPTVVIPALKDGKIVLSNRNVASSLVFQGWIRGLGIETVMQINEHAVGGCWPDMTIFLDVPAKLAKSRSYDQYGDKFERMGIETYEKLREGYEQIMGIAVLGMVRVDGVGSVEEVGQRIEAVVWPVLSAKGYSVDRLEGMD